MSRLATAGALALALTLAAACEPQATSPELTTRLAGNTALGDRDGGALAFGPNAHPYGQDLVEWSERWWQWEVSIPTAQNPSLDLPGSDCTAHQRGEVWNLGVTFAANVVTRSCTVPGDPALGVDLSGILNDYPCPDTSFHPAPGQSLQDFLTQGAQGVVNGVDGLTLTVDGDAVPNLFAYRETTPLFHFTGDVSLQTSLDPCITGSRQPAVADGYFLILKPLRPGSHVVAFTASDTQGNHASVTYNLTVLGEEESSVAER